MKISQFLNRQAQLEVIQHGALYVLKELNLSSREDVYIQFPPLNVICRADIDPKLLLSMTREYVHNTSLFMRLGARAYISVAYLCLLLNLARYLFGRVKLLMPIGFPIIMGGNNRIRFVNSTNTMAIIVPKKLEVDYFASNILDASTNLEIKSLDVMPEIMKCSTSLYIEQQIESVAINRLTFHEYAQDKIDEKLNQYFAIQKRTACKISWQKFLRSKVEIYTTFLKKCDSGYYQKFCEVCRTVEYWYTVNNQDAVVEVGLSHGDLNHGNILYSRRKLSIIDWEFFGIRYVEYDRVIYEYNLRHKSLRDYEIFLSNNCPYEFDELLFLIEDLLFRCLNHKSDIAGSSDHVDLIVELISKRLC